VKERVRKAPCLRGRRRGVEELVTLPLWQGLGRGEGEWGEAAARLAFGLLWACPPRAPGSPWICDVCDFCVFCQSSVYCLAADCR
jgi:hypothetical protein